MNDNNNDNMFEFDKFIENIVEHEESRKTQQPPEQEKTDARRYVERYRELPQNRTVYRK
jgi:hypothetical protein